MKSKLVFIFTVFILGVAQGAPQYFNKDYEEAEQIALESTGLLYPIYPVIKRIMKDLSSIRSKYPEISSVVHKKKWVPSEVVVYGGSDAEIQNIDNSQMFGPLEKVKKFTRSAAVLVFKNTFNSQMLANEISKKFGLRTVPNTSTGDSTTANGSISYDATTGVISIEKSPKGNSFPGYTSKTSWKFIVKNGVPTEL